MLQRAQGEKLGNRDSKKRKEKNNAGPIVELLFTRVLIFVQ